MRKFGPNSVPEVIPVFPLEGALLLPRGDMPLQIFEPRYIAMIDDALAANRVIGMVQPDPEQPDPANGSPALCSIGCAGRLTAFMETEDDRYLITLSGISRFKIVEEMAVTTPYRQCRVSTEAFSGDIVAESGGRSFNRDRLLDALRAYLKANDLDVDWDEINQADNETLVNSLSMAAPYGVAEKQALLEAGDMSRRAELLIAITERQLGAMIGDNDIRLQ